MTKRRITTGRIAVAFAALCMTLWAGMAAAQERFTGQWRFERQDTGAVLMTFDLYEQRGSVAGGGEARAALGEHGPGEIVVQSGSATEGNLQLQLAIRPYDGGSAASAWLQVFAGNGPGRAARLVYRGRTIAGVFVAAGGQIDEPTPRSCIEMDELTAQLNRMEGTDLVSEIRGVYTVNGLAFGGERTQARCRAVLEELYDIQERVTVEQESGACGRVDRLTDEIVLELERIGLLESGYLDQIFYQAGLPSPIGGGGRFTEGACRRAIGPLESYLRDLEREPGAEPPRPNPGTGAIRNEASVVFDTSRGFAPAAGGTGVTLWDHNGSRMAWEYGPGNRRTVWYWTPRSGVRNVGVIRGTLLFEGVREGNRMSGEARIFTDGCGTYVYPVSGPISNDNTRVTLNGSRPVIGGDCRITETRADTLVFDYVADRPGTQPAPAPAPEPQGVEIEDGYDTPGFGVYAEEFRVNDVPRGDTLNMRAGPGTQYRVTDEIPWNGRDIVVIGQGCTPDFNQITFQYASDDDKARLMRDSWCPVDWNGYRGWVSGRYLYPG